MPAKVSGCFVSCNFTMSEKRLLRKQMRAIRDGILDAERKRYSEAIVQKALTLVEEREAKTVFAYLSFGSEVQTHGLIEELLRQGVRVAVPRCNTQTHTMQAITMDGFEDLYKDAYGVLTPKNGKVLLPQEIDLVFVPALAFDEEGYRLGYGGGYYDRYLKAFQGISAGLAFSACCVKELPRDCYDLPVSCILTEE